MYVVAYEIVSNLCLLLIVQKSHSMSKCICQTKSEQFMQLLLLFHLNDTPQFSK